MFSDNDNDGRFPIVPILMEYGGEWAEDGLGWRKYRCPFPRGQAGLCFDQYRARCVQLLSG